MSDLISRKALCEYARNQKDMSVTPNEIMRFQPAQQWIPCSERLPEAEYGESDCVLVTLESGIVGYLYFDGGCWCYADGRVYGHRINPVIAWMPLPEPYKEIENEI